MGAGEKSKIDCKYCWDPGGNIDWKLADWVKIYYVFLIFLA